MDLLPRRSVLPGLFVASALCLALLVARAAWTHTIAYSFLVWNLFLAWVPVALAHGMARLARRRAHPAALLGVGAVWLAFLPNAPYLVTDFIHLRFNTTGPLWFDAVMLTAFAWTGLSLGVASLRTSAAIVRQRVGRVAAIGFVAIVSVLSGYGIYLGRFVRLNSWDIAARPLTALESALAPFAHPFALQRAWTVTIALAALFLVAYVTAGRALGPEEAR
jgi:uncharacterized membrane protein